VADRRGRLAPDDRRRGGARGEPEAEEPEHLGRLPDDAET
jgi:hypothetical protein